MDLEAIRDREHPHAREIVFMNHAGVSPICRRAHDRAARMLDDLLHGRYQARPAWTRLMPGLREKAATLVGARAEEIAFTTNTAHGVSMVAEGLDLAAGDNVVLARVEYPANVYPWWGLARKGIELRFVDEVEGRVPLDAVRAAVDGRTRVLAVSFVEFASGYRNDLAAWKEIAKGAGAFLFVDSIQGLGALPLDVGALGVDFLANGSQKWLLAPQGTAIFYCAAEHLERLRPVLLGADSVVDEENYLDFDLTLKPDARRFEPGSLNKTGLAALDGSLELLLEIGIPEIERRIRLLTDDLVEGLRRLGWNVASPRGEGEWSGIVTATHEEIDPRRALVRLREAGVHASVRSGRLRFSPHYYNSPEEIHLALDVLAGSAS